MTQIRVRADGVLHASEMVVSTYRRRADDLMASETPERRADYEGAFDRASKRARGLATAARVSRLAGDGFVLLSVADAQYLADTGVWP